MELFGIPQKKRIEQLSRRITNGIGTPASIWIHTLFFMGIFVLYFFDVPFDDILLVLTTAVSLEAIYLAIFIQMTVNRHSENLEEVGEDIEEISKDVEEISEDVVEISKDVEEISEDVEEISQDIDKIQEDDRADDAKDEKNKMTLEKIEAGLQKLLQDIETLKQQR